MGVGAVDRGRLPAGNDLLRIHGCIQQLYWRGDDLPVLRLRLANPSIRTSRSQDGGALDIFFGQVRVRHKLRLPRLDSISDCPVLRMLKPEPAMPWAMYADS